MGKAEPPPRPSLPHPLCMIGKDSHGNWVVQEQRGLFGGLFIDRAQALRYALFENGNRPQDIVMVPGTLELDITHRSKAVGGQSALGAMAHDAGAP